MQYDSDSPEWAKEQDLAQIEIKEARLKFFYDHLKFTNDLWCEIDTEDFAAAIRMLRRQKFEVATKEELLEIKDELEDVLNDNNL